MSKAFRAIDADAPDEVDGTDGTTTLIVGSMRDGVITQHILRDLSPDTAQQVLADIDTCVELNLDVAIAIERCHAGQR